MRPIKSKIGFKLVGFYFILVAAVWIQAYVCKELFCGLMVVLPVMPWVFVLEPYLQDSLFVYFLIVGVNSGLLYALGIILERRYR